MEFKTNPKNLETPIFHFSNVVDDYEMKISHVIRGEDHLPNTLKHILLQEGLGFKSPQYAHIPLILAPDRSKLSKRHRAVSVEEYKKEGYLREAIINFLALMGWNPGTEKEIYSMKELAKDFSLEKIQKSGAVFNVQKLDYLNGYYIRNKQIDEITNLCLPYLEKAGLVSAEAKNFDYLKKVIELSRERLKKLSEISELADFFFENKLQYDKGLLIWKKMGDNDVISVLNELINILLKIKDGDWTQKKLETILLKKAEKEKDRGYLLWPLRVALTGKKQSPGPIEIAAILGKKETIRRLNEASSLLQ